MSESPTRRPVDGSRRFGGSCGRGENEEREYAAVREQLIRELVRNEEALTRSLQSRDSVNREYAVLGVQAIPVLGIDQDLSIAVTHFCDENGDCKSVDSLRSRKDSRPHAAAG